MELAFKLNSNKEIIIFTELILRQIQYRKNNVKLVLEVSIDIVTLMVMIILYS